MPSSIKDVAARAGVSVASVSRVLNQSKPVAKETQERVMQAVHELNFSIDQRARALRLQESGTIGLIVAEVGNPFFSEVVSAIEAVAYRANRDLFLCNSSEDPARESFHARAMAAQRIGGVIVLPVRTSGATLRPLLAGHTPVVCLDRRVDDFELDTALVDNELGGRIAAQALADVGHTRVALIAGIENTPSILRERGFLAELEGRGIPVQAEHVRHGDNKESGGYTEMLNLLSTPNRPTGVFVANHPMALGTLRATRDMGLRVPDDMSIVSFDDTAWAPLLDPPLTVITQPVDALGTVATEMLIERMERRYTGAARSIVLKPSLIPRRSVRPPPTAL